MTEQRKKTGGEGKANPRQCHSHKKRRDDGIHHLCHSSKASIGTALYLQSNLPLSLFRIITLTRFIFQYDEVFAAQQYDDEQPQQPAASKPYDGGGSGRTTGGGRLGPQSLREQAIHSIHSRTLRGRNGSFQKCQAPFPSTAKETADPL